jgi:hypothetical protein
MFVASSWRSRAVGVAGAALAAATVLAALPPTAAQAATLPGTIAVTIPASGKLAADTGKQVVVLTVSGSGATALSESNVTGVTLGGDATCANLQNYVVTSATTVTVKTPSGGCDASAGGTAESVSILFGSDDITKATALTFVTPPAIVAAASNPVITDNSVALPAVNQVKRFVTNGGQYVRVTADSAYAFDPKAASGLAVSMGGKAGTDIKVYADATGTTPLATSANGTVGNSFTFKTATGMTNNDNTITVTQNGVSKTFTTTDTGATVVAAPTVTSLSVTSGKTGAATQTVITGTNFDKTAANYGTTTKVTFCGVEASVFGSPAVNAAGTQITVTTPTAVANLVPGLGLLNYAGSCPVVVGDGTAAGSSPITPTSIFTFVKE